MLEWHYKTKNGQDKPIFLKDSRHHTIDNFRHTQYIAVGLMSQPQNQAIKFLQNDAFEFCITVNKLFWKSRLAQKC